MAEGLSGPMEDVSGPSTEGLRESLLEDPFFFFFFAHSNGNAMVLSGVAVLRQDEKKPPLQEQAQSLGW